MYYSNRAAALTSLKRFGEAVRDAKRVVELKPRWAKGYARLGAAHFGLEEYSEVGGLLVGGAVGVYVCKRGCDNSYAGVFDRVGRLESVGSRYQLGWVGALFW